ncbi:hypothetical protein BR93DRAFT_968067 [Coniochaeta sp. PMI_546]|nr:hypothetical protein BR93DRAFT_968067 [Coniochaeta sp. PMI_546]
MGNNISAERQCSSSSSSSENTPPAKRWTAARGRAEGLGSFNQAESLVHQLPTVSLLQKPVDAYSGSQLGRDLAASSNKENTKPTGRSPQTPTPKRRKTHVGRAQRSGGNPRSPTLVSAGSKHAADLAPATANESSESTDELTPCFQNENPASDEDSFPELERLISKYTDGISPSGGGDIIGGKRNSLASPAALKDAAWALQRAWERAGPFRAEAIRSAWERYSEELSNHNIQEAECRSGSIHTGAFKSTPFPTIACDGRKTMQHLASLPLQEVVEQRATPVVANGRRREEILPRVEQETLLPEHQNFIGEETFRRSRCVAPGSMDPQLFSANQNKSSKSQFESLDMPLPWPRRKKGRHNSSGDTWQATKTADLQRPDPANETERSAESARPEDDESTETASFKDEMMEFADLVDAAAESTDDEYLPESSGESSESSESE